MTPQTCLEAIPALLNEIVPAVFETMLSLPLTGSREPWEPSPHRLTAIVHMAGGWNGAVLLESGRDQAQSYARRFLGAAADPARDDVVLDVLGELVNMIGGNLKCGLAPGIGLSMPVVVEGNEYSLRVIGAEVSHRLSFRSEFGVCWVTVLALRQQSGLEAGLFLQHIN